MAFLRTKNFYVFLFVFLYLYLMGIVLNLIIAEKHSFLSFLDIFHRSSDHKEFFFPINNLIENGNYSLSNHTPYAGRLPGYIFPYGIFRSLFAEDIALFLLGIFQLAIKSFSVLCLLRILDSFSISRRLQYVAAGLYLFIPYFWHWDYYYHPNTVSVSLFIILLDCLNRLKSKFSYAQILFCGLLTCYLFLIRPFLGFFFVTTAIFIAAILYKERFHVNKIALVLIIYGAPLFTSESVWVARNYYSFKRFIPFQTSFVPFADNSRSEYSYGSLAKYSMTKVRSLISAWGGECYWYFPQSEMGWFLDFD